MDEVAESIANLSQYFISSLSKTSSSLECSTSIPETADLFEGPLGFFNHTQFIRNICGGKRSSQRQYPWLLAKIRLPYAQRMKESNVGSKNRDVADVEVGVRSGFRTTEDRSIRSVEFSSFETSNESYGNLSQTFIDSLANAERVSSGGAVSKEDLGRATWTFLHTLAAQFPEKPTKQQQRDAKELMDILSRIYPCKECADHFKDVLKAHRVDAKSGEEFAQWMCRVHNVVNRSLGKPQFPCHRVDLRWGALDCDENACDLQGRLHR